LLKDGEPEDEGWGKSNMKTKSQSVVIIFSYRHGEDHYRTLIADGPNVYDRPEFRQELVHLDSEQIGLAFEARLIDADFVRNRSGKWWFLEAGPGAAAGTAHESVFKFVAEKLRGEFASLTNDAVGGSF
jgi:hypothetical protein